MCRAAAPAKSKKIGDGTEEGVDLGPLQNKTQYEKVKAIIAEQQFIIEQLEHYIAG